jgi:hypothetical protein
VLHVDPGVRRDDIAPFIPAKAGMTCLLGDR